MEATESPLDVLSRAATMIQDNSSLNIGDEDDEEGVVGATPRSQKELPTARWRRERLNEYSRVGTLRIRHAPSQPSQPLQPSQPAQTAHSAQPPYVHLQDNAGFPASSSPPQPEVREGRTAPDTPLDMSTRTRCSPPPYGSQLVPPRPSVITCAPANFTWTYQQGNNGAKNSNASSSNSNNNINNNNNNGRQGHRRELLSGMCDPVIDEHFRRSLGKDYMSVFHSETDDLNGISVNKTDASRGNSVTVTGLSVDDHFAKALGDTWVKLQEKSTVDTTASSNSVSVPSHIRDKEKAVLPPPQQQQQQHGIVSI